MSAEETEELHEIVDAVFRDGGVLGSRIEGYREREGQIAMAHAVADGFIKSRHQVIEAPTGTGKSFGAGVPIALGCCLEQRTAIYVTSSIALQDQLDKKDLPEIARIVSELSGEPIDAFQTKVIKGMSNYLCLLGLEEAQRHKTLPPPWNVVIPDWAKSSALGDRSELETNPPDEVWSQVSTSSDECARRSCPHYHRCKVYKNRELAREAHLVVTNYHLFFINQMMVRNGMDSLLPPSDLFILDEFHEAAEIAMDFRGFAVGPHRWASLRKVMERAAQDGSKEAVRLLELLESAGGNFMKKVVERFEAQNKEPVLDDPLGTTCGLDSAIEHCFKLLDKNLDEMSKDKEKYGLQILKAETAIKNAQLFLDELRHVSFGFHKRVTMERGEQVVSWEIGNKEKAGRFYENYVFFFEETRRGSVILRCKVIDTQEFFRSTIFERGTAVMTSATLSSKGSLDFIVDQVGLRKGEYDSLVVESPFDPHNVLVVVPPEFPEPNSREHPQAVAAAMETIFSDMKFGGMMGLFTSYRNLQHVAGHFRTRYGDSIPMFVQGEMGKMQIVDHFLREHERGRKAVILATSSFWQGVDIPGQALSVVAIDKMPFSTPDDPVMWHLERTTTTAFTRYAVPLCVIKLKQGVGRLIRRISDYGVVVLLDPRAADEKKRYHKAIQSAFPEGCYVSSSLKDVSLFLQEKANEAA